MTDDMTPDERLTWLRDHGIEVVTPEERKASQIAQAMNDMSVGEAITYVRVPADTSKPMEELEFTSTDQSLIDHLKPFFASGNVDISLLQQQSTQTLAGNDVPQVSTEVLEQVGKEAHVETFDLVHATRSNNHQGVTMFLDEVGMLKRLPLNVRASKLAEQAGYNPPPQFYGDVFLARVDKRGTKPKHVSFLIQDADSLREGAIHNLEHQSELNQILGRNNNETQPSVAGTEGPKEEGGYSWTQTEEEIEVRVTGLPEGTTSKSVSVKFRPQELKITCNDISLTLGLFERVDVDGCTWTLDSKDGGKDLVVTMEKAEAAFWPRILD